MKILQINAVYEFGSTGRNVSELHNFLLENGVDSYVAYGEGDKRPDERLIYIGNAFDHKLHGLLSRIVGKQGYFSKRQTRILCKKIDGIMPDVVHLHNLHSNYVNLPLLLAHLEKRKIPIVVTLHDCWFFTGKCCHYVGVGCQKWQNECYRCPQLKNNNSSWFFDFTRTMHRDRKKWFGKSGVWAVGVSDWITNEAKKSLLADSEGVSRIYNWIDLSVFKPVDPEIGRKKYGLNNDDTVILAVSQGWNENKGLFDLIKIAESFSQAKVVLVGKIPQEKSLPENMILIPFVSSKEALAEIYSMADVLVNPSRMETFGKVTAEALACGTPAIAYDNTANSELVCDDVGACAKNLNVEDMIDKLSAILSNGKKSYSDNCVRSASERFDARQNMLGYLSLYENIMSKYKNDDGA